MNFTKIIAFSILFFYSFIQIEGKVYQVAFYSDFEPISYSDDRDPLSPEFNHPEGYEVDLLKAMEAIPESDMAFIFHGVKEWNNIWLSPCTNISIDIAIGGITSEDRRLLNKEGKQVLAVTHKTTQFKQSLLINATEASRIKKHEDLTSSYIVGAVRGTTGEYHYLVQTHIMNDLDKGQIKKGMMVVLEDKSYLISDGFLSIYDSRITTRCMLIPYDCTLPITKYFIAEDSMLPALKAGYIDAIARGYIGNNFVADHSNGKYIVSAIYSLDGPESLNCSNNEESVFFVKIDNEELIDKLNQYIDYLTDNGKINYEAWSTNNKVFMKRAQEMLN